MPLFLHRLCALSTSRAVRDAVDTLNVPRRQWEFPSGIWQYGSLRQIASDVPLARALEHYRDRADVYAQCDVRPDLVDASYRLVGLLAREVANKAHYAAGILYTKTEARARIYKIYFFFPRTVEGISCPLLGQALLGHACIGSFTDMEIRGLSPGYSVRLTFVDGTTRTVTVPAGQTYVVVTVDRLVKKIEILDARGRLVASYDGLAGGLDVWIYGGDVGMYVLLADQPVTWSYGWTTIRMSVHRDTIRLVMPELNVDISAVDGELIGVAPCGLRAYNAPSSWRKYVRFR